MTRVLTDVGTSVLDMCFVRHGIYRKTLNLNIAIAIGEFKYHMDCRKGDVSLFFSRPLIFYVICLLHINCMYVDLVFLLYLWYFGDICLKVALAKSPLQNRFDFKGTS